MPTGNFKTTITLHASAIGTVRVAFASHVLLSPILKAAAVRTSFATVITLGASTSGIRPDSFRSQVVIHAAHNGMPRLINPASFSTQVILTPGWIPPRLPRCLTCPYYDKVDGTNNPRLTIQNSIFSSQDQFVGLCRYEAPLPARRDNIPQDATRHNSTSFDAAWTVVGDADYCGRHPAFTQYMIDLGFPPPQRVHES